MGQRPREEDLDSGLAVEEGRPKTRRAGKEPPKYAVFLLNDDYTTMEFVIEILKKYFQRTEQEAVTIMLRVHHSGKGVAGIYSYEIAETKAAQVEEYARTRGFPLKCEVEETQ